MVGDVTGEGEFIGDLTNPGYYAGAFPKLVGKGLQSTGKYALQKAEPYLMGEKRIPMMGHKPKMNLLDEFSYDKPNQQRHSKGWFDNLPEQKKLLQLEEGYKWVNDWINNPNTKRLIKNKNDYNYNITPAELIDRIDAKYTYGKTGSGFSRKIFDKDGNYLETKNFVIDNTDYLPKIRSTTVHELTHNWNKGSDFKIDEDLIKDVFEPRAEFVKAAFSDEPLINPPQKRLDKLKLQQKAHDYYTKPTEVHARIMQIRHQYGLSPGQKLSDADISQIISDGYQHKLQVDPEFFHYIKDKQAFKKLMNTLPATVPAVGLYSLPQFKKQDETKLILEK